MPATLKSRFPEIIAEIPVGVGAAVRAGTEAIAEEAKAQAPDPPPVGQFLKESIEARSGEFTYGSQAGFNDVAGGFGFSTAMGRTLARETAYGIWASWYWYFVEFGTSHSAPEPFMLPAVESGTDDLLAGVEAVLRRL